MIVRRYSKRLVIFATAAFVLTALCVVVWICFRTHQTITVRQPNAYAMQSAGQLIIEHLRLHSGAWPKSWDELRDTCAASKTMILANDAVTEIEKLKSRVEIDWNVDVETVRRSDRPVMVVRLRGGRMDSMEGAEPNEMVWEYLKDFTEPESAAKGSEQFRSEMNSTSSVAGSRR